ncbi:MAG: hypothetical protein WAK16_11770 [Candidatus Cybelea sp.]
MKARLVLAVALVASVAFASSPCAAPAASGGMAWDSVIKLLPNADPATVQPGSFADDFTAASAVQVPPSTGGGLTGKWKQAMASAKGMQAMMQSGLAEKHYVAGSKERTDMLSSQTAIITDCAARTITTLDLRNKTYRVESMDQPGGSGSGGGGGGGKSSGDDMGKLAIVIANQALGALQFGGQPTTGYRSNITVTETKTSGETATHQMNLTGYYSKLSQAVPQCSHFDDLSHTPAGQAGANVTAAISRLMRALASSGLDKRISITQSGPAIPLADLSMWNAVSFSMQGGRQATFVFERGDVRSIDVNDPVFGIPSDFTKQQ